MPVQGYVNHMQDVQWRWDFWYHLLCWYVLCLSTSAILFEMEAIICITLRPLMSNFESFLDVKWYIVFECVKQEVTKGMFIVCCNTAALLVYLLLIYCSAMQCTAPQVHFIPVPQCGSWHRDGNTKTATYPNAAAVDYECSFTLWISNPMLQ